MHFKNFLSLVFVVWHLVMTLGMTLVLSVSFSIKHLITYFGKLLACAFVLWQTKQKNNKAEKFVILTLLIAFRYLFGYFRSIIYREFWWNREKLILNRLVLTVFLETLQKSKVSLLVIFCSKNILLRTLKYSLKASISENYWVLEI